MRTLTIILLSMLLGGCAMYSHKGGAEKLSDGTYFLHVTGNAFASHGDVLRRWYRAASQVCGSDIVVPLDRNSEAYSGQATVGTDTFQWDKHGISGRFACVSP